MIYNLVAWIKLIDDTLVIDRIELCEEELQNDAEEIGFILDEFNANDFETARQAVISLKNDLPNSIIQKVYSLALNPEKAKVTATTLWEHLTREEA